MPTLQEHKDAYQRAYDAKDYEAANRILEKIRSYEAPADTADQGFLSSASDFLSANMEIPLGISGSLAGAGAGFLMGGPAGAVVGGILGGAGGSAAGSVTSDYLEGVPIDYAEATEQALISAGIDIVTIGLGSKVKPFLLSAKAAKMSPDEAAKMFVKEAAMVAGEQANRAVAQAGQREAIARAGGLLASGSPESLKESQKLAEEFGATLLPSQTGQATTVQTLSEGIANLGLFSSGKMNKATERLDNASASALTELMNRSGTDEFQDPQALGQAMSTVIDKGKEAMSTLYSRGLQEIQEGLGQQRTELSPLKASFTKFKNRSQGELRNYLQPSTLRYVDDTLDTMSKLKTLSVKELLEFEKTLKTDIAALGGLGSTGAQREAARELTILSKNIRGVVQRSLDRTNPELGAKYQDLKKAYRVSINGILPKVNARFVTNAQKESYSSLGKMLTRSGGLDEITAMLKSIDESYAVMKKASNKRMPSGLPFKTADKAKQVIKEAYLKNIFTDVGGDFNNQKYSYLASQFQTPENSARLKLILGKDAPRVKQVMNLMSETSATVQGNLGELLFRSKEYAALSAPGKSLTDTKIAGAGGQLYAAYVDALMGGSILVAPVVLANIVTNPKLTNKLLAFDKVKFPTQEAALLAANGIVEELFDTLTDEEIREVQRELRKGREEQE
jgi:hypothetical protein